MENNTRKQRNSKGINYRKGFALKDSPLYDREHFLYYFENRLKEIIKNEVEANFRECFYGLPF